MGRGILSGLIWGAVTGVVVVTVLSLYAPLPNETVAGSEAEPAPTETETEQAPAPEVSEATPPTDSEPADTDATEGEDSAAITPAPQSDAEAGEVVAPDPAPEAPEALADAPEAAPEDSANASPEQRLPAPDSDITIGAAPTTLDQGDAPDAPAQAAEEPAPPANLPDVADAPATPADPSDPPEVTALDDAPATQPDQPSGLNLPQADTAPADVADPEPRVATRQDPEETGEPSATTTLSSDNPIRLPVPSINNPVEGVVTNRLPSVTSPTTPDAEGADAVTENAAAEPIEGDALRSYAATPEEAPTGGLFGVILIDSGDDGVPLDQLVQLSVPFSIAIDPARPDAGERAATYRSAGIEVLAMLGDLPVSAEPSDVAVALEGYFGVLDQAVAVMDPLDGRIQSNRSLLQPVLGKIRDTGHGLVTYDRGLNTAQQAARREGIAAATVFRLLDGDLEEAPKIKRYLSRAAFNAGRDGSVVVVGRTYPETVKALLEWSLDEKGSDLSVVPVSQVMLRNLG